MGIKYFFKWYKDSFPRTIEKCGGKNLSAVPTKLLLLDLNGIIHTSCQKIYRYGAFESKTLLKKSPPVFSGEKDLMVFADVVNSINMFVELIDPKEIVLCIDGVAPISKQIQQRQRRFLSRKTSGGFDPNCISPGTTFLYKLGCYLKTSIEKKLENDWLNVSKIHFMDANVPGEGEHKLFDFLRANETRILETNFTVIIGGNDADLIMLSLLVSTLFLTKNRIYILREDLSSKKLDYLLINVNLLKQNLLDFAKTKPGFVIHKYPSSEGGIRFKRVICDFVVLCFLVGNDFLPQIPLFNIYDGGLDLMMKYYFSCSGYITFKNFQTFQINFIKLKDFFEHILNVISYQAIQHYKTRNYGYPNNLLNVTLCKELPPSEISSHYYRVYSLQHKITKIEVKKYLQEIEWVFNYYAYGSSTVDWNMYYPSQFAPSPIDFVEVLTDISTNGEHGIKHTTKNGPTDPFFQLLCILPPHSSDLLPAPLNDVLREDLRCFHPDEIVIDYEGKLNEWEGIPILPALDYEKVYGHYKKKVKECSKEESKKNAVSNQLMISAV
ncbi:5'-3' exoribonuclease 1 [Chloriridovirus anopheles1]|uniref:5'-3' exoribonuclease 1 n=1 Tax=Chloriridovirus anopheles1 TaxID=1465751 RepID=W8QE83_9VIRU|nr:5'-3' exoribonuclease 1 [Anopheles minimus iridovirus]AHL67615.1 5'-3' exoribonuclease 1 [Anopheles minimus iridovirus]